MSGSFGLDVGTAGHALLALFFRRLAKAQKPFDMPAITWIDRSNLAPSYRDTVFREADRAFRGFRLKFTQWDIQVVSIEQLYTVDDFLGIPGLTFQIRPDLLEAPATIWDHKLYGWERNDEKFDIDFDLRFRAYQIAMEILTGIPHRLKVNVIHKTKEITNKVYMLEPPTNKHADQVRAHLKLCKQHYDEYNHLTVNEVRTNVLHCNRWGQSPCPYITTCTRTHK